MSFNGYPEVHLMYLQCYFTYCWRMNWGSHAIIQFRILCVIIPAPPKKLINLKYICNFNSTNCFVWFWNEEAARSLLLRFSNFMKASKKYAFLAVHVGLLVDTVALGQVFLWVLQGKFCQCHFTTAPYSLVSCGSWTVGPLSATVPSRHSLLHSQYCVHLGVMLN
jgi:hypothetical protein